MNAAITGIGWVTPLGNGLDEVWNHLESGAVAPVTEIGAPHAKRPTFYCPVPPKNVEAVGRRTARIRRSSPITYFSVTAGLAALEDAGETLLPTGLEPNRAARTAVIFAICSGGVNYTRRFYEKIKAEGPASASPILFPETVYNAPASHLAAALGIDGASYTLVGDGSVGLSALQFARELLATEPELEQCVVVGAEECDWILWEGYAAWRLLTSEPCLRLHAAQPAGTILSEGAAAVVVRRPAGKPGEVTFDATVSTYANQRTAAAALDSVLKTLPLSGAQAVIGSANGTWIDAVESAALAKHLPGIPARYPKAAIGDSLGAGGLLQAALGAYALAEGKISARKVAVTSLGLNQQVGGAILGNTD